MKFGLLSLLVSWIAVSFLPGADLEVTMVSPPRLGPSPIIVDSKSPTPLMALLPKRAVELLISDDPDITPKVRVRETRVIHGVQEEMVYKVIPDSIGLDGYQNLEFSFRKLDDGNTRVDLVWALGKKRQKASMMVDSHLLVELRNPRNERSVFCVLGIGGAVEKVADGEGE